MNNTTEQSEKRLVQGGYSIFVKQANTLKLGEEHYHFIAICAPVIILVFFSNRKNITLNCNNKPKNLKKTKQNKKLIIAMIILK